MTANPFDQASRYTGKLAPPGFLDWLLPGVRTVADYRGWLDTRTIPFPGEPDRVCDTVAGLVEHADPAAWWALPIEFQSRPDPELFGRLLEYLARLWRELRPLGLPASRYKIVAAVVNLTGVGQTSRDMTLAATGARTCLQVVERNLAEEDAAATLTEIAAGRWARCLLPWIPLMRGGAEAAIMGQWKQLAQAEPDDRRRADYGGLALVFAELAARRPAWKQALEGWNVEQSQQVLEWQAEAEKRGIVKGEAKGKAEGKAEGKVEGEAKALLRLLERRFSMLVPADLATTIQATRDIAQLDRWFDAAIDVATLDEFRRSVML